MVLVNPKVLENQSQTVDKLWDMVFETGRPDNEIIVYGPVETAKSFQCLLLAHSLCSVVPNFNCTVLRKAKTTNYSTTLKTLVSHILPYALEERAENPVTAYGGPNSPRNLIYKNTGAEMWFLGEDDKTGKALGTEWDMAIYSQVEQSEPGFWAELTGRCTGRSDNWYINGRPHAIAIGECNPGSSNHHLRIREENEQCRMLKFLHTDNPKIFYDGIYTEYGTQTMARIKRRWIEGSVDYQRMVEGLWVAAEGMVWPEFNPKTHVIPMTFSDYKDWTWYGSTDYGINHPSVFQLWARSPCFKKAHLFKEIYKTGLTEYRFAGEIKKLLDLYGIAYHMEIEGDYAGDGNQTLNEFGLNVRDANKDVLYGLDAVRQYMAGANDYELRINEDPLAHQVDQNLRENSRPYNTIQSILDYVYKPLDKQNTGTYRDELPDKSRGGDDGADAMRYRLAPWVQPPIIFGSIPTASTKMPSSLPGYMK